MKTLNQMERAEYSQTILTCSTKSKICLAYPIGFGDIRLKDRVKFVLNYKKTSSWIVMIAFIVSIIFAVCFLTNPNTERLLNTNCEDVTSQSHISASSNQQVGNSNEVSSDENGQHPSSQWKIDFKTMQRTVQAKIIQIYESSILIEMCDDMYGGVPCRLNITDETVILVDGCETNISKLQLGQRLQVVMHGYLKETYPLQGDAIEITVK